MSDKHTEGRLTVDQQQGFHLISDTGDFVGGTGGRYLPNIQRADARRLAACWNAFEGVPTDKIEGKTVAEYVSNEAYLNGMAPGADGVNMGLSGLACQMLADAFAGQFKGSGAINFLELTLEHPETGEFLVTMQRKEGETPAQQKAAALRDLRAVEANYEAARALLTELLDNSDAFTSAIELGSFGLDGEEWTKRARAFLEGKEQHPDDVAVDRFAAAMKAKMAASRAKGRNGWNDPALCPTERLQTMLRAHIGKGDPVDVGNFAMMLFNRGERTRMPPDPKLMAALETALQSGAAGALLPDGSAVFINRGEQPEEDQDLHCPACGGSGHVDDYRAHQSTDTVQAEPAKMECLSCGVDRFKSPCPNMADECPMIADAHLLAPKAAKVGTIGHHGEVTPVILDACAGVAVAKEAASATDAGTVPHTFAGFRASFQMQTGDQPNGQDAFNAGMRAGRDLEKRETASAQATPEGGQGLPPLPGFIRKAVERAIEAAKHPQGMGVHDGMVRLHASHVERLLMAHDALASSQQVAEPVAEVAAGVFNLLSIVPLVSYDKIPVGTKLYRAAPPQQPQDELLREAVTHLRLHAQEYGQPGQNGLIARIAAALAQKGVDG